MRRGAKRRIGRRGVTAFLAFVGVFLVAEQALTEKAALLKAEAKFERTVDSLPDTFVGLSADLEEERRALELRWIELWALLAVGALALLVGLALAFGVGANPRLHGAALLLLAAAPALAFGEIASVLTLAFGGALAQVPDRYFAAPAASAE